MSVTNASLVFADSSVWIDYFNGKDTEKTDALDAALAERRAVTGDLILTEVLQGFRRDDDYATARRALTRLTVEAMLGRAAAIEAADAFRSLRSRGVTVRKTIDVLIACHCVRHGHTLLHADRDFDLMAPVLGLRTA